jgi:hypothetical protein
LAFASSPPDRRSHYYFFVGLLILGKPLSYIAEMQIPQAFRVCSKLPKRPTGDVNVHLFSEPQLVSTGAHRILRWRNTRMSATGGPLYSLSIEWDFRMNCSGRTRNFRINPHNENRPSTSSGQAVVWATGPIRKHYGDEHEIKNCDPDSSGADRCRRFYS